MSGSRHAKHGLLQMPVELLQQILVSLSEPRSIALVIQTSRILYLSFKEHEQHIISSALLNCFGTGGLLREAELTWDCMLPVPATDFRRDPMAHVKRFLGVGLEGSHRGRSSWTLRDAWEIHSFHADVILPLKDLFIQASSDPELCAISAGVNKSLKTRPVSDLEAERICRTLYRFEMFRRLYGWLDSSYGFRDDDLWDLSVAFFPRFAPWEIAQMGCIHDFLGHQVATVFNDIARHDITWGHARVDFDTHALDNTIQHILSLGLRQVLAIARLTNSNYSEREAFFDPDNNIAAENEDFFNDVLWDLNCSSRTSFDRSDIYYKLISAKPCHVDGDPGPEIMWRLSCPADGSSLAFFQDHDYIPRRWGYVLWDHERLCNLAQQGVIRLSPPWEPAVNRQVELPTPSQQEREASWRMRSSLYARGGRGWWAEGDESRVRWSEKRPPSRDQQSLEREQAIKEWGVYKPRRQPMYVARRDLL